MCVCGGRDDLEECGTCAVPDSLRGSATGEMEPVRGTAPTYAVAVWPDEQPF